MSISHELRVAWEREAKDVARWAVLEFGMDENECAKNFVDRKEKRWREERKKWVKYGREDARYLRLVGKEFTKHVDEYVEAEGKYFEIVEFRELKKVRERMEENMREAEGKEIRNNATDSAKVKNNAKQSSSETERDLRHIDTLHRPVVDRPHTSKVKPVSGVIEPQNTSHFNTTRNRCSVKETDIRDTKSLATKQKLDFEHKKQNLNSVRQRVGISAQREVTRVVTDSALSWYDVAKRIESVRTSSEDTMATVDANKGVGVTVSHGRVSDEGMDDRVGIVPVSELEINKCSNSDAISGNKVIAPCQALLATSGTGCKHLLPERGTATIGSYGCANKEWQNTNKNESPVKENTKVIAPVEQGDVLATPTHREVHGANGTGETSVIVGTKGLVSRADTHEVTPLRDTDNVSSTVSLSKDNESVTMDMGWVINPGDTSHVFNTVSFCVDDSVDVTGCKIHPGNTSKVSSTDPLNADGSVTMMVYGEKPWDTDEVSTTDSLSLNESASDDRNCDNDSIPMTSTPTYEDMTFDMTDRDTDNLEPQKDRGDNRECLDTDDCSTDPGLDFIDKETDLKSNVDQENSTDGYADEVCVLTTPTHDQDVSSRSRGSNNYFDQHCKLQNPDEKSDVTETDVAVLETDSLLETDDRLTGKESEISIDANQPPQHYEFTSEQSLSKSTQSRQDVTTTDRVVCWEGKDTSWSFEIAKDSEIAVSEIEGVVAATGMTVEIILLNSTQGVTTSSVEHCSNLELMGTESLNLVTATVLKDRVHDGLEGRNRVKDANFKMDLPVTLYDTRSKCLLNMEKPSAKAVTDKYGSNMTASYAISTMTENEGNTDISIHSRRRGRRQLMDIRTDRRRGEADKTLVKIIDVKTVTLPDAAVGQCYPNVRVSKTDSLPIIGDWRMACIDVELYWIKPINQTVSFDQSDESLQSDDLSINAQSVSLREGQIIATQEHIVATKSHQAMTESKDVISLMNLQCETETLDQKFQSGSQTSDVIYQPENELHFDLLSYDSSGD